MDIEGGEYYAINGMLKVLAQSRPVLFIEFHERILRESFRVNWHVRKLSPGKRASRRAKNLAKSKGIILQPGTTIVRPHKRGRPDEDVSAVPVRAQGLASLVLSIPPL